MLGRLRRTTRVDVGLAISFAGVAYLVWALVAGASRELVKEVIKTGWTRDLVLPGFTTAIKIFFVDAGIGIDIVGLVWLAASLVLVLLGSRQRVSISWAWLSAICQSIVAAVGAVTVAWAAYLPHVVHIDAPDPTAWQQLMGLSLPVMMAIAVVVWVTFLVWMLVERARLDRHVPTLGDGLRTNIYR